MCRRAGSWRLGTLSEGWDGGGTEGDEFGENPFFRAGMLGSPGRVRILGPGGMRSLRPHVGTL